MMAGTGQLLLPRCNIPENQSTEETNNYTQFFQQQQINAQHKHYGSQ